MRTWAALLLAGFVGFSGVGLRMAIGVTPVDEAYRDVLRFYRVLGPAAR